jgi:hypothetical protein
VAATHVPELTCRIFPLSEEVIDGRPDGAAPATHTPLLTYKICPLLDEVTAGSIIFPIAVPFIEFANIFHL